MKNNKPTYTNTIALHGTKFHKAAIMCLPWSGSPYDKLVEPGIVNLAFAIECYLKAFLHLEKGERVRKHALDQLFSELSQGLQRRVIDRYVALPFSSTSDFQAVLSAMANAFVDWRYVFEKNNCSADWSDMFNLARVLYETAVLDEIVIDDGLLEELVPPFEQALFRRF